MPVTTHDKTSMNAVDYFRTKLGFESTPHQLKNDMEARKVVLIDVRDPESYAQEHIAGAINVPLAELERKLSTLDKSKTLVTYCWDITCAMAPKAALILAEKGYSVQELVGGIKEWKGKSFPVESGKPAPSRR